MSRWTAWPGRALSRIIFMGLDVAGRLPGLRYPRFLSLEARARRAVARGDGALAAVLGRELLALADEYREDWNYGNAVHHGHLVLGHVALMERDLANARAELLLAGSTPGSPQLSSFGPSMGLAQELLRAGARDAVLEYLELCRRFWHNGADRLDAWISDIGQGRAPVFGPNLSY